MVSPMFYNSKGELVPTKPNEDTIHFDEVKPYSPKKVTPITISKKDEEELQQWSASSTQAVRKRTLRQETMMTKMGTLAYYIYTKNVKEIAESNSEYQFKEKEALEEKDSGTDEFDSSSDEELPVMGDKFEDRAVF